MKQFIYVFLLIIGSLQYSCKEPTCEDLKSFKNADSAIKEVKTVEFPYEKSHTLLSTEWMKSATFKSCDNETGFLLYIDRNTGKEFIHQNVPMDNWLGLLQDAKKGNYYNLKIRGKFPIILNKQLK